MRSAKAGAPKSCTGQCWKGKQDSDSSTSYAFKISVHYSGGSSFPVLHILLETTAPTAVVTLWCDQEIIWTNRYSIRLSVHLLAITSLTPLLKLFRYWRKEAIWLHNATQDEDTQVKTLQRY
jgi:hypothetical protein